MYLNKDEKLKVFLLNRFIINQLIAIYYSDLLRRKQVIRVFDACTYIQ